MNADERENLAAKRHRKRKKKANDEFPANKVEWSGGVLE
jgi:hypothetical protein